MSNLFWPVRRNASARDDEIRTEAIDGISPGPDATPRDIRTDYDSNERLDQLLLVCAAMWELLREKTSLTETDLIDKVAEIDARDGTADGKFTPTPQPCPQCRRTIFPKHRRCLYCGAEIPIDSIFKTI